ncbi:hypothetical protein B0H11DRAFT_1928843 [Mycena galericulata]|nr:hypothetical protein B0H11DRAFT_1928843 [Mycena galericulata]
MVSLSSRKGFPIGNFLIRKVDLRLLLREWNQTIIRSRHKLGTAYSAQHSVHTGANKPASAPYRRPHKGRYIRMGPGNKPGAGGLFRDTRTVGHAAGESLRNMVKRRNRPENQKLPGPEPQQTGPKAQGGSKTTGNKKRLKKKKKKEQESEKERPLEYDRLWIVGGTGQILEDSFNLY